MSVSAEKWAEQVRAGDVRAMSRAITAIENHQPEADELLRLVFPYTGRAYLTGITGAPGTGKSTLADRLAAHYRKQQERVGVIAVDPTSPYSGGAILGDRIRMQGHAGDSGMFIRSMATRGFLGGLARATAEVALLLDAAGKQQVLIETVGVGQDEVDIVRLADCVVVVVVPGMGDDIQNMNDGWHPPVVRTVATENKGIDILAETIGKFRNHFETSGKRQRKQVEHWKRRLVDLLESRLLEKALGSVEGQKRLEELALEVAQRKKDPFAAVKEILAKSGLAN
jgi:LAO/AO transport system kinase